MLQQRFAGLVRTLLPWIVAASCWAQSASAPITRSSDRPKTSHAHPPDVILISLDTTRADRMGFLGSKRGLTPNLDTLARQATVFSRAYAQVPLTTPSHATILTGTYPLFHHVNYLGDSLAEGLPYLPEILHKNGYRTAAFVGALVLDPHKFAPGFDRRFDIYEAGFHRRRREEDRFQSLEQMRSIHIGFWRMLTHSWVRMRKQALSARRLIALRVREDRGLALRRKIPISRKVMPRRAGLYIRREKQSPLVVRTIPPDDCSRSN